MTSQLNPSSLTGSLLKISSDYVLRRILSLLRYDQLGELAKELSRANVYRCATAAELSLGILGVGSVAAEGACSHIEHLLWCAWRSAQGTRLHEFEISNLGFAKETIGNPTILVGPMTVATTDSIRGLGEAFSDRQVIMYGEEELSSQAKSLPANVRLVDNSASALKEILTVLSAGGVYCTYADYVYPGHKQMLGKLFNVRRAFSQSFLSLCSRDGVHLLPTYFKRDGACVCLTFDESVVFSFEQLEKRDRILGLIEHVEAILERFILQDPAAWLLLTTLAVDAQKASGGHLLQGPIMHQLASA